MWGGGCSDTRVSHNAAPQRCLYLMLSVLCTWHPSLSASSTFSQILRSSGLGSPFCRTIPTRPDSLPPTLAVPLTPCGGTWRGTTCCWFGALKLVHTDRSLKLAHAVQLILSLNSSTLASCDSHHGVTLLLHLDLPLQLLVGQASSSPILDSALLRCAVWNSPLV